MPPILLKKIKEGPLTSFQSLLIFYHISNFHANVDEGRREVEENKRNGGGGEEVFDLAQGGEGVLKLDVFPAARKIGVDVFQNAAGRAGREAGEREARDDAVGFLKTIIFQIYIDFFRRVIHHNQARIANALQFFCQRRIDFKTKKNAIPLHFFQNFFRDDSRSAAELNDALCLAKIDF